MAIPLSAIGANEHLPGLLIAWAGIVGVNVAQSMGWLFTDRERERARRRDPDAWED